jgi:hypothetical protein
MPMVSTFQNATPISFLSEGSQGTLQYQTPIGISTTVGPGYMSAFGMQLNLTLNQDDSFGPQAYWNKCGTGATDANESDNWTGGIDNCQFQTLASSADSNGGPIDQWMLIPFAQQNTGNVSLGDVFAIITSYTMSQMVPTPDTTNISFPLGVITNGLTGNSLLDAINTSSSSSNESLVGFMQLLRINQSFLNGVNYFLSDEFTGQFQNQFYQCTGSFGNLNNFLFMVTDNTGRVPSPVPSTQSFYTCPCSISQCLLCNVPGKLAFLDPVSGVKCPVLCTQQKPGSPCAFLIDTTNCPACQEGDCTPICTENQVCERDLSTGVCQCVDLPSSKRNIVSLIVLIVFIVGIVGGSFIFMFIQNRKVKRIQTQQRQDLLQHITQL